MFDSTLLWHNSCVGRPAAYIILMTSLLKWPSTSEHQRPMGVSQTQCLLLVLNKCDSEQTGIGIELQNYIWWGCCVRMAGGSQNIITADVGKFPETLQKKTEIKSPSDNGRFVQNSSRFSIRQSSYILLHCGQRYWSWETRQIIINNKSHEWTLHAYKL